MSPVPLPPREPDRAGDALERALCEQALLSAPPDLTARVLAALPQPDRRILSLPAVARLAAAVLLALGTWVATTGSVPTLAYAEPSPLVAEVLAPTRDVLPDSPVELPSLALGSPAAGGGDVPAAALAGAGALLVAAGLFLARRGVTEKRR